MALVSAAVLAFPASARADDEEAGADPALEPPVTIPVGIATIARVHIASPIPVVLEERAPGRGAWAAACAAPCDRNLPLGDEYRMKYGKGVDPGEPFRLCAPPGGTVTLTVRPASSAGQAAGGAIIVVGAVLGIASLAGVVVFGTSASGSCPSGTPSAPVDRQAAEDAAGAADACGWGKGIAGALAIISGIGMLVGGGIVAGGASLLVNSGAATTQKKGLPLTAFVREPTWVGPRAASSAGKPAFVVPLSFSF